MSPAVIHWSSDNWKSKNEFETRDTGAGIFVYDLPTAVLDADSQIQFTFFWPETNHWEGQNFTVKVISRTAY